jgi:hypothetical protein
MKPTFRRAGAAFFGSFILVAGFLALAVATKPAPLTVHQAREHYQRAVAERHLSAAHERRLHLAERELQGAINREREQACAEE